MLADDWLLVGNACWEVSDRLLFILICMFSCDGTFVVFDLFLADFCERVSEISVT